MADNNQDKKKITTKLRLPPARRPPFDAAQGTKILNRWVSSYGDRQAFCSKGENGFPIGIVNR